MNPLTDMEARRIMIDGLQHDLLLADDPRHANAEQLVDQWLADHNRNDTLPSDILCRLCGQPINPTGPWADWHLTTPDRDEGRRPFHIECLETISRSHGLDTTWPYNIHWISGDWADRILWQSRWMPDQTSLHDALLARTLCTRLHGADHDPADENPFQVAEHRFADRSRFAHDWMPAYANALNLTDQEAQYLPWLLHPTDLDDWTVSLNDKAMTRIALADRVRGMACSSRLREWKPDATATPEPDIWTMV